MMESNREAKQWGMFAHMAAFVGYVIPFGWILGPLLIWLMKKDDMAFVDDQGREALNFQLNFAIYSIVFGVVCFILMFVVVGIFIAMIGAPILALGHVVLTIIGGIEASKGTYYRYPGVLFRFF